MFIRQVKKQRSKSSKVFYQYTLAQTSRIDGKVKQHSILYLGSDPLLSDKENRRIVLELLKAKIFGQPTLFPSKAPKQLVDLANQYYEKYCIKYDGQTDNPTSIPPATHKAEFHNVDIKGLDVIDSREFGAEHLCTQTLEKLQLASLFKDLGMSRTEVKTALIAIAAKAIYRSSEYKTSQILSINSSLKECYNYNKDITHKQLYATADLLYRHKEQIDKYLYQRITNMFGIKDKLVIFDISNTYFETRKSESKIATYGRSKEKRNDCPLVVFTGVINADGFIRHSRIYEGNKTDNETLSDMIEELERYSSSHTQHTIVIDAGIADDENLKYLSEAGYKYVCVSRKRIKDYNLDNTKPKEIRLTKKGKDKVELSIFKPQGYEDTWMYVESESKRRKESSMNIKLQQRYEQQLNEIKNALSKKRGTKKINKVWERIGRAKQKNSKVSSRYIIDVTEKEGKAINISWTIKENKIKKDKSKGVYFIRTNLDTTSESELWDIYNTIREVESTFRSLKTDLKIRPVHHQKDDRIESHIYLTILAYQMVNTIRYMLKNNDINLDWTNIVRVMSTQKLQTIIIPTDKKNIYLRKPSVPIEQVKQIYKATRCNNTQKPIKKHVVYH